MRARRTPAFRARKRYELRCDAKASRTLRRYGYCEADKWTEREADDARDLLIDLVAVAGRRRKDMERAGQRVDNDTWLWGDVEPDYDGELARAVVRLAAGDAMRKAALEKVAERLLDRTCVRVTTAVESAHARELLEGVDVAAAGNLSEEAWRELLRQRADVLEPSDATRNGALRGVARGVASCLVRRGEWADEVEDALSLQVQSLHMPAVKEALGALIPARLHRTLDEAVKKGKDAFGVLPGGANLRMDDWKVNVRGEDALGRGSLSEEMLEFFLKVLRHVLRVLDVPVAIASKTVGKEIGVQETPERMHRVFSKWAAVWDRTDVRKRKELVLTVAVDDKKARRDWVFVAVRSCVADELLGDAKQLCVDVHDSMVRTEVARRIAKNIVVLVRGIEARSDGCVPKVECVKTPDARVESQRVLYAYGRLVCHVAAMAGLPVMDAASEAFVPDVGHASRALFAHLRQQADERGVRDIARILKSDRDACERLLKMFVEVPPLVSREPSDPSGLWTGGDRGGGGGGGGGGGSGTDGVSGNGVGSASNVVGAAPSRGRGPNVEMLGVASWNIAGGHKSVQAPKGYGAEDQRARQMAEILRWERSFGADVVALQECEEATAYRELQRRYELVGTAEAVANRGFVHVYVRRRDDIEFERLDVGAAAPCVAVRIDFGSEGGARQSLVLVAVHLPAGDAVDGRRQILKRVLEKLGARGRERVLLVGDMNVNKDAEAIQLCDDLQLKEERYEGFSWGVPGNRFYADMTSGGRGLRKDRVLFGEMVWAKAHLVGQCEHFFDGSKFHLSDHFGVMAYVDVSPVYASITRKQDVLAARARRAEIANFMRQCQQKDQVEVRALQQRGRDSQALEQQRARERDRVSFQGAQR